MDVRRLRLVTIVAPLAFLIALELLSLFVLVPSFGHSSMTRLLVIFAILTVAVVPFSFWVFATIERQQRDAVQSAILLESVQDYAIFMLDPQGRVATWSQGAERLKGYRAEEIIGQPVSRFYSPEDVARGEPERILQMAAEGRAEDEGWRLRKDGSRFWANVVSTAIRNRDGALAGFTQVTHDVTERKQAEEALRESEQRFRALSRQLERRVAELHAANIAIASISSALDLENVLQKITDATRELLQSRYAALGVADEQGRIVQFITSGLTPEQRAAIGPLPRGHGLLGALINEGQPLRIADIAKDPRSHGFPPNHPPMRSLLGVPILFQGKPVGDLYLTDKVGAEEFSEEDQELLILLANHAAVAIENARLYGEVRTARDRLQVWNEELEAKVTERTKEIERYSKELTTRVLQAQEEERKRIARELHDETAQSLSTLLINLDLLEPAMPAENGLLQAGFERVRMLARRTLDETRALSHDLRPTILDDVGLVAALHWFADEYTRTFGVPVEVETEQPPVERLSPEMEVALFRVAQEALTNSGKYAGTGWAHVALTFPDGTAKLMVEDDGRGFDLDQITGPTRRGGLGLFGMKERADLLGGTLTIDTAPGEGTRITVVAPLEDDRAGQAAATAEAGSAGRAL